MLRHIVMIKFSERRTVEKNAGEVKAMLTKLTFEIDSLLAMEVGLNINTKASAYDLVLTADFEDEAGLDAYRVHPAHVKVLDYLKTTMEKARVVDYYI
jgi:hypothetical protein